MKDFSPFRELFGKTQLNGAPFKGAGFNSTFQKLLQNGQKSFTSFTGGSLLEQFGDKVQLDPHHICSRSYKVGYRSFSATDQAKFTRMIGEISEEIIRIIVLSACRFEKEQYLCVNGFKIVRKMKRIRLENFRCYEDLTVNFKSGVNLLIGDNATGKTTVLKACRYVLSAFFSGYSDENTRWESPINDDFSVRIADGVILPESPVRIFFLPDAAQYATLPAEMEEAEYVVQKNSKKNSRSLARGLEGFRDHARSLVNAEGKPLPLFASFSTENIHSTRRLDTARFKTYFQKASFGYYECLNGDGFFPYWLKRLLVLQEGQKNLHEIASVRTAVSKALGTGGCGIIDDLSIRPNQGKVYYIFSDDREVDAEHLSDGYRRLVNIVTDIAFRCALLNGRLYGADAMINTTGTVLIDEIDMHLHPTLQANVLKGLQRAFPKLQFIVTSHAPMVMTSVKNDDYNVVYRLSYEQGQYSVQESDTYGMDASTITEAVLRQTPRDREVDEQLKKLFEYIDSDSAPEAWVLLKGMRNRFGDRLPELAEAEAMLNFSIAEDHEKD